jgi:hypothetical protein
LPLREVWAAAENAVGGAVGGCFACASNLANRSRRAFTLSDSLRTSLADALVPFKVPATPTLPPE